MYEDVIFASIIHSKNVILSSSEPVLPAYTASATKYQSHVMQTINIVPPNLNEPVCIATWQTDSVKIRRIPVKVSIRRELTEKEKEELR